MGSRVTEVVAQELSINEFSEYPPQVSMFGVTSVEIESSAKESKGNRYRIYLVKDTKEEITNSLDECARLCAFYNTRFVLQYVRTNKIDYPVGNLQIHFQIEDGEQNHSVFVLEVPKGQPAKTTLSLNELLTVAENIAKLHGKTAESLSQTFCNTINANYTNVKLCEEKISQRVIDILRQSVQGEYAQYFARPGDVVEMLNCILDHPGKEYSDIQYSEVICHGGLTGADCIFGLEKHSLVEIKNWELVHFGDPTEDLTNLLIASADTETRRKNFMKVFRAYYFALIELRPLKFKLANLKQLYRKNSKKAVISGIEALLNTLSSNATKEEKVTAAHRWEAALFDVHHYEFGDYISDDEQCLFEK